MGPFHMELFGALHNKETLDRHLKEMEGRAPCLNDGSRQRAQCRGLKLEELGTLARQHGRGLREE